MSKLQNLNIANLAGAEDERIEYKSSATPFGTLKDKLGRAASGFWNSGGGIFVAGVDGQGKPDGGLAQLVGKQPVRDWVDQVLKDVSPAGIYDVRIFNGDPSSGLNIGATHGVIAVEFEASANPPHMAPDHKYYIRAGAHTVPASQYIVEALWARRRFQHPQLAHAMRPKPEASEIIQLVVLPLTDEPAVNVVLSLDPLPELWKEAKGSFPLRLPVLDRSTPFYLDITTFYAAKERLGPAVKLNVEYEDLAKNHYNYAATLDTKAMAPWKIGKPASEKMAESLESVERAFQKIPKALDELRRETTRVRGQIRAIGRMGYRRRSRSVRARLKALSSDAQTLLQKAKSGGTITFSPYIGGSHLYAGDTDLMSDPKSNREEARWKSAIFELIDDELIDGVFGHGSSTIFRLTKMGYEVADAMPG